MMSYAEKRSKRQDSPAKLAEIERRVKDLQRHSFNARQRNHEIPRSELDQARVGDNESSSYRPRQRCKIIPQDHLYPAFDEICYELAARALLLVSGRDFLGRILQGAARDCGSACRPRPFGVGGCQDRLCPGYQQCGQSQAGSGWLSTGNVMAAGCCGAFPG